MMWTTWPARLLGPVVGWIRLSITIPMPAAMLAAAFGGWADPVMWSILLACAAVLHFALRAAHRRRAAYAAVNLMHASPLLIWAPFWKSLARTSGHCYPGSPAGSSWSAGNENHHPALHRKSECDCCGCRGPRPGGYGPVLRLALTPQNIGRVPVVRRVASSVGPAGPYRRGRQAGFDHRGARGIGAVAPGELEAANGA